MSGSGGGGGYQYQAQAAAYIATHILAKRPLHWFDCISDVPIAVAEETDGPGDDIKITLQDCSVIELQAKHGLKKDGKFWEAIVKLIRGLVKDLSLYGVLLTNSRAIPSIRDELREDIIRLGQGREDNLKAITTEVIDRLNKERVPYDSEIFKRLRIVIVDLDDSIRNAKVALEVLSNVLHNPEQEGQSWSILCNDGLDLIKKRGQRNAESLSQLLGRYNIQLASSLSANSEREIVWQGWQQVCRSMLDRQIQFPTLNDLMAKDGVRIDPARLFVPIGLIERKQKQYRRSDVDFAEQASQLLQPTEEEIVRRFDQEEDFFNQVICNPNISDNARFVITGEPGAGKTTLLQKIGDRLCKVGMLPVWISLGKRRVPPTYEFLSDVLKNNAQVQNYGSVDWNASIRALLQTGKVWLLLDGADELTTNGNPLQVIGSQLQEVWSGQVKVIVTCRLNAWDTHALPKFTVFRILEFDYQTPANGYQNQVEAYIHQFFEKEEVDPQLAPSLIQQLHTPGKERIRDLVKNPLRLSLLCYIWESGIGELPDTKAELYRLFIDYYYELQELKHPEISIDRTERDALNLALGEVAKTAFDSEDSRFRLRKRLIESISIMGKENAKGSLFDKAVRLGWLNYIGTTTEKPYESVYAFFHASFQEYFAVLAIDNWDYFLPHDHENKPVRQENKLDKHKSYRIFNSRWREVISLWTSQEKGRNSNKYQTFLEKLFAFQDGVNNFYTYQTLFIIIDIVTELRDPIPRWFEDLIKEFICILTGDKNEYFNAETSTWVFPLCLYADVRKTLQKANIGEVKLILTELLQGIKSDDYSCLLEISSLLFDLDQDNSLACCVLINLMKVYLQNKDNGYLGRIAIAAALKILKKDPNNINAKKVLKLQQYSYVKQEIKKIDKKINLIIDANLFRNLSDELNLEQKPLNNQEMFTVSILTDLILKTSDELIRWRSLYKLQSVLEKERITNSEKSILVEKLKIFLRNPVINKTDENEDFKFRQDCYKILWYCAQNMSYPDFYRAWHSSSSAYTELPIGDGEIKL